MCLRHPLHESLKLSGDNLSSSWYYVDAQLKRHEVEVTAAHAEPLPKGVGHPGTMSSHLKAKSLQANASGKAAGTRQVTAENFLRPGSTLIWVT